MSDFLTGILPLVFIFGTSALLLYARDRQRNRRSETAESCTPEEQQQEPSQPAKRTVREEVKEFHPPNIAAFERPCRVLKFTEGLRFITFFKRRFLVHKSRVAGFDCGSCHLYLTNGKEYSYSDWMPHWVKNKVLPEGTTKVASIEDFNYTRVTDEKSASTKFYPLGKGEPEFYKEGKLEIVAHSETPLPLQKKLLIVCRGSMYDVILTTLNRFIFGKAEVYESDQPIASIRNVFCWFTASFKKEMPLLDCIFICLLVAHYVDEEQEGTQRMTRHA